MSAIFRREFSAYFKSPLGYVFLTLMFVYTGFFFYYVFGYGYNKIDYVFSSIFLIFLMCIPLLTMRLMSEERHNKTDQALLTAPVSLNGIIWGKFLAALSLLGISLIMTVVYFFIFSVMSTPQWSIFIGNILGVFLLGGALISIGLLISTLTEQQIISAIVTFAVMVLIYFWNSAVSLIPIDFIKNILSTLSFTSRYDDFTSGVLDFSNVLFFLSAIFVFNFLSVRALEKRRWS